MDIAFDRGSSEKPRGHALLYFRSTDDPEEVWVTYLVVLPVIVDLTKYVPPFLMNQVGEVGPKHLSALAFPPAPERLGSYAELEDIAAQRDDDILFAGTVNPTDVLAAMTWVNDATQRYAEIYSQVVAPAEKGEGADGAESSGASVNEVLYGLMSEEDKLGELTRLVGRLQFAIEGSDQKPVREAEDEINVLSRHLPASHSIPQLLRAVKSSDSRGAELAELYLQRCYHLFQEEYTKLGEVEEKIGELERLQSSG